MKDKLQVIGIQRLHGRSKAGNDYDFCQLKVLNAIQSDNRSEGFGFQEKSIDVSSDKVKLVLEKLSKVEFPRLMEVHLDTVKNDYGNFVAQVVDVG